MSLQGYVHQLRPRKESYANHVDNIKNYLIESKIKAEDYEAAIVIGWHKIHNIKLNPSSVGISPKVIKLL